MENVILSFKIVFPLFAMIALGYSIKCFGMWDDDLLKRVNKIVFKVFFPFHLFNSVYHTDLASTLNKRLMIFSVVCVLIQLIVVWTLVPFFVKNNARRGAIIQGMFRSNMVLFGIPVTAALFGQENVGAAALVIAVVVPIYNAMAVVVLEIYRGGRVSVRKIVVGIITNPMVVGTLAGLAALLLGVRLPGVIEGTISDIAKATTPLALMILGGSFKFAAMGANKKALTAVVLVRLLISPAVFLSAAIALGFRGVELAVLLSVFAVPTATSSFTMAQQMDSDSELAGQIVVFTTLLSVLTIFGWVLLLKQFGFM